jgi:hypothetical protein
MKILIFLLFSLNLSSQNCSMFLTESPVSTDMIFAKIGTLSDECVSSSWIKKLQLFRCESGNEYIKMITESRIYFFRNCDFNTWCKSESKGSFYHSRVKTDTFCHFNSYLKSKRRCIAKTNDGSRCEHTTDKRFCHQHK